jgi:hypothetical protein
MGRRIFILTIYFLHCFIGIAFSQNELLLKPVPVISHTMFSPIPVSTKALPNLFGLDQISPVLLNMEVATNCSAKKGGSATLKICELQSQ